LIKMEEKFSVSLELMIQKFKDKVKQVKDVSKNVANKIKENMSVDVGGGAFKGMNAESELLLNKINDIKATLQMASDNPKLLPKQDILEMRVELEKLEGQYNKINKSSNMFSSSFNKIQDGMNKSLKSAKRFTLSLFGIQSVYRMLSRASSAYLAQDEETSSKIQSAWIGLGSVFAPLLQAVANFAIKAVSYINVFIKALTGTDFLANSMAKSMNKANKSAGKLSKTLAGFDEITNLDDDAGASVDTSWIDSFKDVKLNPKIVKYLKNIANWLKENKELIFSIVGVFAGSVIIMKLIDIFSWLTSIKGLSMAIIFIGIAVAIDGIIKAIKDPSWKNYMQIIGGLSIAIAGLILLISGPAGWTVALGLVVVGIGALIGSMMLQESRSERLKKANADLKKSEEELKISKDNLRRATDDYIYAVDREEQASKDLVEAEKRLGISGADLQKQVDNGTLSYKDMNDAQREVYKKYREYINAQDDLKKSMEKVTDETKNVSDKTKIMEANVKKVLDINNYKGAGNDFLVWWQGVWTKASKLAKIIMGNFSISAGFSGGGGSGGGGFAKGLDVVPFDGMYKLHKDETVVPAKFTPSMHGLGSNSNQDLINEIRAMREDIQRIEIKPYTTIRDVGQASQKYRTQQSRIIGEELS
jgi:hypothetical protein